MEISTIEELKQWMKNNCYNNTYGIGETNYEGFSLTTSGELYIWSYSERGNTENINYFATEKEAVEFVQKTLINDKFARTHFIGYLSDKFKEEEITSELLKIGIQLHKDLIPTLSGNKIRFLVVGCGLEKIDDLKYLFTLN